MQTPATSERMDQQFVAELAPAWWLLLVTGGLWLVVSHVVLRFDVTSVSAVGYLVGAVVLGAGLSEFLVAALVPAWRWLHVALGAIFVAVGIAAFFHPGNAFWVLASLVGWFLLFKGMSDIFYAIADKDANDLWWLTLIVGILELLLAFWAAGGFFGRKAALVIIWVGFAALFRGITEIVLAFQLRSAGKRLAQADG